LAALLVLLTGSPAAHAQFLRVGPFDFTSKVYTEAVYTTNVEGERESEAEQEREDYYLVLGVDLISQADITPRTSLDLDTGIAMEKHFVRSDLDNSEEPFGRVRLKSNTEIGRLRFMTFAAWERKSESADDVVLTGGRSKKTRNPSTTIDYGAEVRWDREPIRLGAGYEHTRERYEKEEFQDGDKDETTVDFDIAWIITPTLSLGYKLERTRTEDVNDPADDAPWKTTETISLDWRLAILERPTLTYTLGVEKEDTDEEKGEWEPTHTLTIMDRWDLTKALELQADASYSYEDKPEEDDIAFTYGVILSHEISRTADQQLSATREPRATFGSTAESDTTELTYNFVKRDLFIYNLEFRFMAGYETTKTPGQPTENVLSYETGLEHSSLVTRRLSRSLRYLYTYEDSNLEDEILDEHRVELRYEFQL